MRRNILIIAGFMVLFSLHCITLDIPNNDQNKSEAALTFPKPQNSGWIYRKLNNFYSRDKAEAILLNMQPYIYQYRGENVLAKATDLKLENEAVKISWEWEEEVKESITQTSTSTVEKDITGDVVKAIFSRNKQDMTSALISALTPSPSTTTTSTMVVSKKVTKRNNTIFMFEDVNNVFTFQNNFLNIKLKSGEEVNLVINNEYYRDKWCDALLSFVRHKGYKRDFFLGAIVRKSEIPKQLVKSIGVKGALVLGVMKDSPAEEIGLAYKDIITKVDKVNVYSGLDLENYFKRIRKIKNNDRISLEIIRINDESGKITTANLKKTVVVSL